VGPPAAGAAPDAAVSATPGTPVDRLLATGAPHLLFDRPLRAADRRRLRRDGFHVQPYVTLPRHGDVALYVPVGRPAVGDYALGPLTAPPDRWRRIRNKVTAAIIGRGLQPPGLRTVTVASRRAGPPWVVRAATGREPIEVVGWILATPGRDDLSRAIVHLLPAGSRVPALVVKFARVAGYTEPFDRDHHGLNLAATAGGVTAQHAPRPILRFDREGIAFSVETAVPGSTLLAFLCSDASREAKSGLIEDIARWRVEVSKATLQQASHADAFRDEIRRTLPERWQRDGLAEQLVAAVAEVPAALMHDDLGSWNVIAGEGGFAAIDWEDARADGLPLIDLVYFLADALAWLDGAWAAADRDAHTLALFRGELPSSAVLFRWIRESVAATGLDPAVVGPLVTLTWLRCTTGEAVRNRELARQRGPSAPAGSSVAAARVADGWMADPALGPGWERWRGADPRASGAG
jgi:hypothetical protein